MVVDALLAIIVLQHCWHWRLWAAIAALGPFVFIASTFLAANSLKIAHGGWMPILFGGALVIVMLTWRRGTAILAEKTRRIEVSLRDLVTRLDAKPPHRVPGTAIFLTGNPEGAPTALLHNLKHNKIIHERNIIMTIRTEQTPRVPPAQRVDDRASSRRRFQRITMSFGYMETPNILKGIAACRKQGLAFDIMSTSFFMSRRSLKASAHSGMPVWQDKLFIALAELGGFGDRLFPHPGRARGGDRGAGHRLDAGRSAACGRQSRRTPLDRFSLYPLSEGVTRGEGGAMLETMYLAILIGAGLVMAAVFTSWIAFRFGAPILLIFLAVGLLAGEDGLGHRVRQFAGRPISSAAWRSPSSSSIPASARSSPPSARRRCRRSCSPRSAWC